MTAAARKRGPLLPLVIALADRARYSEHARTWQPGLVKVANVGLGIALIVALVDMIVAALLALKMGRRACPSMPSSKLRVVQPANGSLPNQVFPSIISRAASRWPAWQDSSVMTCSRMLLRSGRRQFGQICTGHTAGS